MTRQAVNYIVAQAGKHACAGCLPIMICRMRTRSLPTLSAGGMGLRCLRSLHGIRLTGCQGAKHLNRPQATTLLRLSPPIIRLWQILLI